MMNKERKVLLVILYFALILSLSVVNLVVLKDRRDRSLSESSLLEQQLSKVRKKRLIIPDGTLLSLRELVDGERGMFFSVEEEDPYTLGLEIIAMLEYRGVEIVQYKTLEMKDEVLLEFTVESGPYSFFSFLKDLGSKSRYYKVPYLAVTNRNEGISSTFRIGQAVYE
ncbi:hypothetical protein [Spirochaeta isovalerica]|uniref:Uncharacterized protein n=1 Tax=Spirochaeta isovalerica TaxID=150 RepID=A0A841R6U2_9SPIO|nr:hypothetical protein [Spirochaeta isovalerica]MBB6478488.1 hypothetical protein [Spirochaeta isovalerica]